MREREVGGGGSEERERITKSIYWYSWCYIIKNVK